MPGASGIVTPRSIGAEEAIGPDTFTPMILADVLPTVAEMKASSRAILLVEQNVHQALTASDRSIALERCHIALTGDAASTTEPERLPETVAF